MNQKKTTLLLVGLLALLLVGAGVLYTALSGRVDREQLAVSSPDPTAQGGTSDGDSHAGHDHAEHSAAPDFTVYDVQGRAVRLSDFFGKPIVLNFWASWCPPCQGEMPEFDKVCQELGDEVQFLMVDMANGYNGETVEVAAAFIAEKGYQFPVFYDTDSSAMTAYQAYSLPTTYFLDSHGHLVAQATGAIDEATLRRGIEMSQTNG